MTTLSTDLKSFIDTYDVARQANVRLTQLKMIEFPNEAQKAEINALRDKIADNQFLTVDLVNQAKDLSQRIDTYYKQTPLQRLEELSPMNDFIVGGELNVLAIHEHELQVASQVKRFQEIIANQQALVPLYEAKIKKIEKEWRKTSDPSIKTKLQGEIGKLNTEISRINELYSAGDKLASPRPINYEEMSLLYSIKNIFEIEGNLPPLSQDLLEQMRTAIQAKIQETQLLAQSTETRSEDKAETEKRLMAMQELCSYYETYSANKEETKPLSFSGPIKMKQIRYELPQKHRNTQGGITSATMTKEDEGVFFDIPPEQNLYVPKQANAHLTFENGAHLIVTPKSELYLPSKQHFGTGANFDANAFQASVNLFAEQYTKIHGPFNGTNRMTLNFSGVDDETAKEMKEAFIAALIEKACVKMVNGERKVDTLSLRNLYISTQDLEVAHVFEKFKEDQGLPREIYDFDPLKRKSDLDPSVALRGKLSQDQARIKVTELINKCVRKFGEEIEKYPDPIDLRNNNSLFYASLGKEEWNLKRAICIVASYDDYQKSPSPDKNYEKAKALIREKLELQHKGVSGYNVENDLENFIKTRIKDRQMCQAARRPGLS